MDCKENRLLRTVRFKLFFLEACAPVFDVRTPFSACIYISNNYAELHKHSQKDVVPQGQIGVAVQFDAAQVVVAVVQIPAL